MREKPASAARPAAAAINLPLIGALDPASLSLPALTLADLSPAGRYGYLAAYNLIYVVPLAAIVIVFARSLGARKLSEREGRLLKLVSGVMMLELGALLLLAPERFSQVGIAFGLMAVAVLVTYIAAKLTRGE